MKRPAFAFGAKIGGKAKRCWICSACGHWHDVMPGKKNGPRNCVKCDSFCHHFQSQAEAGRYMELRTLQAHGKIGALKCQPRFPLNIIAPSGAVKGFGAYVADFQFEDFESSPPLVRTQDIKGSAMTELSDMKRRIAEWLYGIEIEIVKR